MEILKKPVYSKKYFGQRVKHATFGKKKPSLYCFMKDTGVLVPFEYCESNYNFFFHVRLFKDQI